MKMIALIIVFQVIVTMITMKPNTTTSRPEGVGVGVLLEEITRPKWSSIAIKKMSYKKGIATDPIPATSRLT